MPEPTDDSPEVRTFAAFLVEHNGSVSHAELTKSLTELVERVEETGRTGTLTYVLREQRARDQDILTSEPF